MDTNKFFEILVKFYPEKPVQIYFTEGMFVIETNGQKVRAASIQECVNLIKETWVTIWANNAITEFEKEGYTYDKLKK